MASQTSTGHKYIMIVDRDSILAAALAHLLQREAGSRTVLSVERAEWCGAVREFRPDCVIIPSHDLCPTAEELAFLSSVAVAPRIILVSPDCNEARVYDISCATLWKIRDLLTLIGEDAGSEKAGPEEVNGRMAPLCSTVETLALLGAKGEGQ